MAKSTEIAGNQDEKLELTNQSDTTEVDLDMITPEQVNLILAGVLTFPPNH